MPEHPFDGKLFGMLADVLAGTIHADPHKKVELGYKCTKRLDALGEQLSDFECNVTDPALVSALQEAILAAKHARFAFRKTVRLYELVREQRNRYGRVCNGNYTAEDKQAAIDFGYSIRSFHAKAEAA